MTYLYQLHAHFTGHELEVQQIGKTSDKSNYVIGRFVTDKDTDVTSQLFGQEINNLRKNKQNLQIIRKTEDKEKADGYNEQVNSNDLKLMQSKLRLPLAVNLTNRPAENLEDHKERSPTSVKDVKDILFNGPKNIIGKVLSPSKDKLGQSTKKSDTKKEKPMLMTRRELCDPFGSDEEDEIVQDTTSADSKIINKFLEEADKSIVNGDNLEVDSKDGSPEKLAEVPKINPVSFTCLIENCFELF